MATYKDPLTTLTQLIKEPQDEEPIRPQEQGFQFSFGLNEPLDPSIGFFSATYVQMDNSKPTKPKIRTPLPFAPCGPKFYEAAEKRPDQLNAINCLTSTDYELSGNYYSDEMDYIDISLYQCQNGTATDP